MSPSPALPAAAHHPRLARTHRLSLHRIPTFSSTFDPSLASNVIAPPPVAHLAPSSSFSSTRGEKRGPKRVQSWHDPAIDVSTPSGAEKETASLPAAATTSSSFSFERALDRPRIPLSGFLVAPHPHDSPLLAAPLELDPSVVSGSGSGSSTSSLRLRPPMSLAAAQAKRSPLPLPLALPAPLAASHPAAAADLSLSLSLDDLNLASSRRPPRPPRAVGSAFGRRPSPSLKERTPSSSPSSLERTRRTSHHVPSTPSLDITAAFPSLLLSPPSAPSNSGAGLGIDFAPSSSFSSSSAASDSTLSSSAGDIFDEAFPSPPLPPAAAHSLSPSLQALAAAYAPLSGSGSSSSADGAGAGMEDDGFVKTHHRRGQSSGSGFGLRELELVKRRESWGRYEGEKEEPAVEEEEEEEEEELVEEDEEDERFEDALEDEEDDVDDEGGGRLRFEARDAVKPQLLRLPLPTSPSSFSAKSLSPDSSFSANLEPRSNGASEGLEVGLGLGLGIDFLPTASDGAVAVEEGATVDLQRDEALGMGLGLGIDLGVEEGEREETDLPSRATLVVERAEGSVEDSFAADPSTPTLRPSSPSLLLTRSSLIRAGSPRATRVGSTRAVKTKSKPVGKGKGGAMRRVYPPVEMGRGEKERMKREVDEHGTPAPLSPQNQDAYHPFAHSPSLSSLPGSFLPSPPLLASPVLPTTFADWSHSPLPTPPQRFSRVRRAQGQQQTAALPTFLEQGRAASTGASLLPTTTPGAAPSSTASASSTSVGGLLVASSPSATPTLAASPTFSPSPAFAPLSPSLGAPAADDASVFPSSAPATPIPDQAAAAAASTTTTGAAATQTGQQMSQAMFDAAIASTVLGAVAALGMLGWLAMSVLRRRKNGREEERRRRSDRGIGSDDAKRFEEEKSEYEYGDGYGGAGPALTDLPRVPPLAAGTAARLSFPPSTNRSAPPSPTLQHHDSSGGGRTFSSHFDGWIDVSSTGLSPSPHASTEEYGGYPTEVARGDGMSTYERRMSRASKAMSVQSGSGYYSAHSHSHEHRLTPRPSTSANRSSYRSSTGAASSVFDSTWSSTGRRSGTAMSSRTSLHHGGGTGSGINPGDCFVASPSAGAPPRLPESIPPRVSGDASTYFATPPGTPTKTTFGSSSEPPVPSLTEKYPVPPLPSTAPPAAVSRSSTRARSGSRSNPSTAGPGGTSKLPLKSALKSLPSSLADRAVKDAEESPTEAALRKLERRRATIDAGGGTAGGILADGLQALFFQAHLDSAAGTSASGDPLAKQGGDGGAEKGAGGRDVFASSTPRSGVAGRRASAGAKTPVNKLRKTRPQTMPPKIVVSNARRPVTPASATTTTPPAPPPFSAPAKPTSSTPTPAARRARSSTVDTDILDARASMKTIEGLPWLSQSPSSTFSCHPRDDVSVVDPDMRYERKHFSTDSTPAVPSRVSKDFSGFVAAGIAAAASTATPPPTSNSGGKHAPLDSIDIASRRLASEEDLASQSSAAEHDERDTDDEAALRSLRRKTLLYSVYKERGVDLASAMPSPSPSSVSPSSVAAAAAASPLPTSSSGSRTTDSDDSSTDSPIKGALRQALVESFPSPPPIPSASSFSNLAHDGGSGSKRNSTGPIDVDAALVVAQRAPSPPTKRHSVDSKKLTASSPSAPPPRPPRSPGRPLSQLTTTVSPPTPSTVASPASSRFSISRPSPSPRPALAPLSSNAPRAPPSPIPPRLAALATAASKPAIPPAPIRSFAAELQESVGNPADGYDSDTLMTALAFNKPGHTLWSSIYGVGGGGSETLSASSSAYGGFSTAASLAGPASPGGSTLTAGSGSALYSTSPGSIESLEEAAIAQAETVQFGRSRASGVAHFSWRSKTTAQGQAQAVDESEESAYEESDAETLMWRARMGLAVAE
ncbi:hypothetical protein JCM6882_001381 [Rhodosporidiobolus microsporus]